LQKVELPSSADVERVKPQFHKMMDFHGRGGVIITALAPEDSEYDFVSRFFCPKAGISEDPATGSAHCTLGPYWASKLGKKELKAFQVSKLIYRLLCLEHLNVQIVGFCSSKGYIQNCP
jgi:predicted PhzF superfamily epimerase YddE/YHI9